MMTARAAPPAFSMLATLLSRSPAVRPVTTTRAPLAASADAIARPMPRPAPVTMATASARREGPSVALRIIGATAARRGERRDVGTEVHQDRSRPPMLYGAGRKSHPESGG